MTTFAAGWLSCLVLVTALNRDGAAWLWAGLLVIVVAG